MFVRNLAWKADEEAMREAMAKFGEVKDVYIPRDPSEEGPSRSHRGFGFVTVANQAEADKAIAALKGRL